MDEKHYIAAELICRNAYEKKFEANNHLNSKEEILNFCREAIKLFQDLKPHIGGDAFDNKKEDNEKLWYDLALSRVCDEGVLHFYRLLKEQS